MAVFLGLGSNEGDRKSNLERAISIVASRGFAIRQISPVVETPALLPEGAESSWNRPYLNCVLEGEVDWLPNEGLEIAKEIEHELGRKPSEKWAPRPIDIDLLIWHDQIIQLENLSIPHEGILDRHFVITPLLHLRPDLIIPGQHKTVYQLSQAVKPVPLWMGVLNITPDSFSDGGRFPDEQSLSDHMDSLISENIHIMDIGAESTRPRAEPVDPDTEWQRLEPAIQMAKAKCVDQRISPLLSVDSRHAGTLEKALDCGIGMINDVSGLEDPKICALARESGCQVIAMHSMTVPVNPDVLLPSDRNPVDQMIEWLDVRIESWLESGLNLNKIIFDPGIGFGKTASQSMELLQRCDELRQHGLRLLIGHSRKSFMNTFASPNFRDRDMETLGVAMSLCEKGVDIIRVHDPVSNIRAYRGWSHIA